MYEFEMFAHDFFSLGLNKRKNNRKLLYFICLIYATYMQHKNDILKAVTEQWLDIRSNLIFSVKRLRDTHDLYGKKCRN